MSIRAIPWLIALTLTIPARSLAETVADWGTVVTPLESAATFSFAQYDVTKNFTHDYLFSLEGETGATYEVTFAFNSCTSGCGNPDLSYGIYDDNGGLYGATSGTVLLSAGNYAFQVSGTGFGAGNSVDYWGDVTFSATLVTADAIVAPVPEPATFVLTGVGVGVIGWAARRARRAQRRASMPPLPVGAGSA